MTSIAKPPVRHPGLPSHPQHELVKRQCCGHSGMISFYLKGGLEESRRLLSSMKVSWGFYFRTVNE